MCLFVIIQGRKIRYGAVHLALWDGLGERFENGKVGAEDKTHLVSGSSLNKGSIRILPVQ